MPFIENTLQTFTAQFGGEKKKNNNYKIKYLKLWANAFSKI